VGGEGFEVTINEVARQPVDTAHASALQRLDDEIRDGE
jgi:hypothetical protein